MLEYQKAVGRYLKKPHQNRFLNKKLIYTPSKKNMETQVKTRNVLTPKFGSESPNLEILRCPGHSHHRRASAACTFGGPIFGYQRLVVDHSIPMVLWDFQWTARFFSNKLYYLLLPRSMDWIGTFFSFWVFFQFFWSSRDVNEQKITNRTSKSLRVSFSAWWKTLGCSYCSYPETWIH